MTEPNFLEIEWKLRRAIGIAESAPATRSSGDYLQILRETVAHFTRITRETDETYIAWRMKRGERMRTFRDLRRMTDRARLLAEEHGLEGFPSDRVVYTDEVVMQAFVEKCAAFLDGHDDEWDWISEKVTDLRREIGVATEQKAAAAELFAVYRVRVKERVAAFDRAKAVLNDYLHDGRLDVSSHEDWEKIQLVAR